MNKIARGVWSFVLYCCLGLLLVAVPVVLFGMTLTDGGNILEAPAVQFGVAAVVIATGLVGVARSFNWGSE